MATNFKIKNIPEILETATLLFDSAIIGQKEVIDLLSLIDIEVQPYRVADDFPITVPEIERLTNELAGRLDKIPNFLKIQAD